MLSLGTAVEELAQDSLDLAFPEFIHRHGVALCTGYCGLVKGQMLHPQHPRNHSGSSTVSHQDPSALVG